MYLSRLELDQLLKNPYFQNVKNRSVSKFTLYRGHFNASVLTLRYSIISPQFNEQQMITNCIQEVMDEFSPKHKSVRGLIEYDLILKANPVDEINEDSYYFWRANSNRSAVANSETTLSLNHDSIFLFIHQAAHINPSELNIYYVNSNVTVDRITSIIFTFISV